MESTVVAGILRKKGVPQPASGTPILDLFEPVPPPADRLVTGRFALPFLTFVSLIIFTGNTYFLIVPFGYLAIAVIGVAIHELGHLIAGWSVGMSFVGVQAGPLVAHNINGTWALRLRPVIHSGQAMMSLGRIRRMRKRLAVFVIGGPISSFAAGWLACAFGEMYRESDSIGWTTFLEFFGVFCVVLGVLSSIPYSIRGHGNDAFLLRKLCCDRKSAISFISAYALESAIRKAPIVPEYHEKWSRRAAAESTAIHAQFVREYELYRKAEDCNVAAEHLEKLFRYSPWMDDVFRNHVIAEAFVHHACRKPDRHKAETWFKRLISVNWFHPIERTRISIATLFIRGDHPQAMAELSATLDFIHRHVNGPASREVEAGWLKWQDDLERRIQARAVDAACE